MHIKEVNLELTHLNFHLSWCWIRYAEDSSRWTMNLRAMTVSQLYCWPAYGLYACTCICTAGIRLSDGKWPSNTSIKIADLSIRVYLNCQECSWGVVHSFLTLKADDVIRSSKCDCPGQNREQTKQALPHFCALMFIAHRIIPWAQWGLCRLCIGTRAVKQE